MKKARGYELLRSITYRRDPYSQLLMTLYFNIGEALFPLLEDAERQCKRLAIDESNMPELWDEVTVENVIMINRTK